MCLAAVAIALESYLLGSVPFSVLMGKLAGRDVTKEGSKNPGALNVYRTTGNILLATAALVLDVGKGALAAFLALLFAPKYAFLAPIFAVVGHNWSPWLRFRGGRGLSVLIGASIIMQPTFIITWAVLWLFGYVFSGYIAVGALFGYVFTPVIHSLVFGEPALGLVLALVPIWMRYVSKVDALVSGKLPKHFWRVRA